MINLFHWLSGLLNKEDGTVSHSKLWANVASAAATYKFIMTPDATAEIWLAYLGLVGGYAVARRWIAARMETTTGNGHHAG